MVTWGVVLVVMGEVPNVILEFPCHSMVVSNIVLCFFAERDSEEEKHRLQNGRIALHVLRFYRTPDSNVSASELLFWEVSLSAALARWDSRVGILAVSFTSERNDRVDVQCIHRTG